MLQLKTLIHSGININQGTQFTRLTARAIVIKNNKILVTIQPHLQ